MRNGWIHLTNEGSCVDKFRMVPVTRKASNAQYRVCRMLGIPADQLIWERVGALEGDSSKFMAVAVGDRGWDTIRWFQSRNDPDWNVEKIEAK